MKLAILTCGMLPIPAVQGGAVENLIDFYLEYNDTHKLHDITVYSPWNKKVASHPALASDVNHYLFIDVTSLKARITRKLRSFFHSNEYYNYFIEYYCERIYANLKKQHFDYIILENCDGYAYKLSQRGYKNLILHMHNERRESRAIYDKIVYNSITKIITVSDYIKGRAALHYPIDKIETIHNGIDLKIFERKKVSSVSRQQLGFDDNDFLMVYSGRINKEKGISELLDAMLLLKNEYKIKLLIIGGSFFGNSTGEDNFIKEIKAKALPLENKIVFTDFIPYNQIPNYLNIADVTVIPSIWNDPFPTTVLEAQAMGLPIITTRRGGIPEEVTEYNAILLDINEQFIDNLANAILDLYKKPEKREHMSIASLKHARLFEKEIFARNFFEALEIKK